MERVWKVLGRKQTTVGSAAFVLVSMVAASRVLGLVRDRMLSARFVPDELGVYFAAFRLPNLIFELLIMGALTSAFIPVFTKYLSHKKEQEAGRIAATLINVSVIVLLIFSIPVFVWTPAISRFFAPGFSNDQISQMTQFTRFMIGFQVLPLVIGNFFTGILQSYNLFLIPAVAPVVYNVGIIAGIIILTPTLGLWAPVLGVGVGALLFMAIQMPILIRIGYRHRFEMNLRLSGVAEVAHLMGPRTLGLAVSQIDTTVDLMLASLLGARMVTIFNFAQHLQQLPVGLFGATVAQAALPLLSKQLANGDTEEFKRTLIRSLHQILFFVIPASVLFIVLRIPVVRLVFGAARFDWEATVLTGMTLSTFSLSLFAQSISHVLARGFYALYDSKTPVFIGILAIATNTILSLVFIRVFHLPIWSLGLSTSIASFVNAAFLLWFLNRRVGGFSKWDLLVPPVKMGFAAGITGIALYIPLKLLDQLVFDTTRVLGLVFLTGASSAIGLATYVFLSWVMGVGEVRFLVSLLNKVKRLRVLLVDSVESRTTY